MKSATLLAAVIASHLAFTCSVNADSIGINFATGRNAAEIDLLLPNEIVGVIAQGNWNNVTGNNGSLANVTSRLAGTLVNDLGAATTLSIGFTSTNSWSTYGSSQTGNRQLLNGYLDNTTATTPTTLTLSLIPYAVYDIYIYVGSDTNGRVGHVTLAGGPTIFFSTITSPFDDTFTAATGTSTGDANAAEYVRFAGLNWRQPILHRHARYRECGRSRRASRPGSGALHRTASVWSVRHEYADSPSAIERENLCGIVNPCRVRRVYAASLRRLTCVLSGACALIFGGCAFFPGAKPAPREVILDPTKRPTTTQVEVLRDDPDRRHRVIAELEVSYDTKDGGAPVDELVKRAKALGAHAIILVPPETTWRVTSQKGALDEYTPVNSERFPVTTLRSRSVFSARAIVFE